MGATLLDGDGLTPTQEQVLDWAQDYLDGDGYDHAVREASEDMHETRYAERD